MLDYYAAVDAIISASHITEFEYLISRNSSIPHENTRNAYYEHIARDTLFYYIISEYYFIK